MYGRVYEGVVEEITNPNSLYELAEDVNRQVINIQSLGAGPAGLREVELAMTLQRAVQRLRTESNKFKVDFPDFKAPADQTLERMLTNATASITRNSHLLSES